MFASDDLAGARVLSVRIGRVAPLGPRGVPSGFVKHGVAGPALATPAGLAGDAVADRRLHGGRDKAVYAYPAAHWPAWAAEFPALAFRPGAMGENLTLAGPVEDAIHIGDRVRIGGALFEVTQPRQPCFKLGLALGDPEVVRAMTRSGRCGWYYRVVESGTVDEGDAVHLVDRPNPDWTVARFAELVAARALARPLLTELAAMEGLAEQWRLKALRMLAEPAARRVGPEGFEPPTKPL